MMMKKKKKKRRKRIETNRAECTRMTSGGDGVVDVEEERKRLQSRNPVNSPKSWQYRSLPRKTPNSCARRYLFASAIVIYCREYVFFDLVSASLS